LEYRIDFNPKTKQGSLLLWSHYNGTLLPRDPIANGNNSASEVNALLFGKGMGDCCANFPIGNVNDLISILAAIASIKHGKDFSFSNYEGRTISFQLTKEGKEQQDVVSVKIRYSSNIGKLVSYETIELETVVRNILANLGYSNQEIVEKVESTVSQSSI
jgi:hypothetical protein